MNAFTSRRDFLKRMSSVAAGCAACGSTGLFNSLFAGSQTWSQGGKLPNVLFIPVDDLRTQLGCYGHSETLSPNIDRLAGEGVLFERAYCQVPVCGASRASLMTGIRPHFKADRFTDFNSRADKDTPEAISLAKHFKQNGYYTISNGKVFHHIDDMGDSWHEKALPVPTFDLSRHPAGSAEQTLWLDPDSNNFIHPKSNRGPFFESADVPDEAYHDGKVAAKTISDLRRLKDKDQPFFLACGFFMPHLPWNVPKRYYDMYNPEEIDLADFRERPRNLPSEVRNSAEIILNYSRVDEFGWPDSDRFHRQARHAYYASVSYVDTLIGKILDELKVLELDRDTIVILWGDHGYHLGEYNFWGKHNTLNNSLQVPLIVRAPEHSAGIRTGALVEFVDIYSSLCELAGLPPPQSHRLHGKSFVPLMNDPGMAWKEAAYSEWHDGSVVKTDRYIYTEWPSGSRMLFDHYTDPYETVNIADEPENAEKLVLFGKMVADLERDYLL